MNNGREKIQRLILTIIAVVSIVGTIQAGPTFSFVSITNNNAESAAIGEAQLSVELFDLGDAVTFVFSNSGTEASSICDIYFDDGINSLFSSPITLADIDNSEAGVSFSPGATPGNLPGGNTVSFFATDGLSADSDSPITANGVNPGETVGITLSYNDGVDFDDLLNEMANGDLCIGLHVQGFSNGFSEGFITNGFPSVVPVPGSLLLATIGIGSIRLLRRKNKHIKLKQHD